jgi:hypothetical protein
MLEQQLTTGTGYTQYTSPAGNTTKTYTSSAGNTTTTTRVYTRSSASAAGTGAGKARK